MRDSTSTPCLLFRDLFGRPLTAAFDLPNASSDGGAVLLKAADRRLGLISRLAAALVDERQPGKVRHGMADVLGQRIYGLALGYEDANDAARLADDPMRKLLLGRDPLTGDPLASQPTLSRFENDLTRGELKAMSEALFETVLDRHARRRRKARRITLDLDVTDDPTHGAQQMTFFSGCYDSDCYLPMLAFLTFDREREPFLCAAALRPGNAATHAGALTLLKRIIDRLQERFPRARILVRLDGGFATPELFEFFDLVGIDYVVACPKNQVLERQVDLDMIVARVLSDATNRTEHVYTDFSYAAGTWERERRVVCKAEVVRLEGREPRLNARFVVTNLPHAPKFVYERVYCMRGDAENRIADLHEGREPYAHASRLPPNGEALGPCHCPECHRRRGKRRDPGRLVRDSRRWRPQGRWPRAAGVAARRGSCGGTGYAAAAALVAAVGET